MSPWDVHRLPLVTIAITALTAALSLLAPLTEPGSGSLFWRLALDSEAPGEVWRWASGHLLHTSPTHLLWNLLALAVLGALVEHHSRRLLLASLAAGAGTVSLWFFVQNGFTYYVGWSGVLNTLLVTALFSQYAPPDGDVEAPDRRAHNTLLGGIAVAALLKNIAEFESGMSLTAVGPWPAAPGAHLAGFAGGVALLLAYRWHRLAPMRQPLPEAPGAPHNEATLTP